MLINIANIVSTSFRYIKIHQYTEGIKAKKDTVRPFIDLTFFRVCWAYFEE